MTIYRANQVKTSYNPANFPLTAGRDRLKSPFPLTSTPTRALRSPANIMSSIPVNTSLPFATKDDYHGMLGLDGDLSLDMRNINDSRLAEVVRKSLQRDDFRIQGWRARQLGGGVGNPVSLGLYCFEGVGFSRNEWLDWSIVLKVIQSPANAGLTDLGEGEDQSHWNYWKREIFAYQSGWLSSLPEGIVAPHCYEVTSLPGDVAGLWMEDIEDSFNGSWPLYRYALAARHLGRLNGIYVSHRQLPSFPWLSLERNRQWLKMVPWRDFPWEHPRVRQQFSGGEQNGFHRLLQEKERFLGKLDELPKTISHGDTYPTNFKSRRVKGNLEQTVALDWALMGIEPLGDDLGQLVYGTYMNLKGYKLQDISHTLFASYINGLQDSGCHVDADLVRFGYTASAALRVGLFKIVLVGETLHREDGQLEMVVDPSAVTDSFESVMAEEAFRLLDDL